MMINVMASPLENLDKDLRESLRNDMVAETQKRGQIQKAAELQKMVWEQRRRHADSNESRVVPAVMYQVEGVNAKREEEEMRDAVACVKAKELEIEKRKTQVQGKVRAHLSRLESQGRRLEELNRELECLEDPTKKEVAEIRKKIECVDRDLKPLKQLCDRKEKELKEAVHQFNEKNKLKNDLVSKLMEIVTTSERQRMQKLDELNKQLEAMEVSKNIVKC